MRLPGAGDITGQIRWALGGRLGIEFYDMIELPVSAMLAEVLKK